MTELTYTKNGDYLIPDLTLSETCLLYTSLFGAGV